MLTKLTGPTQRLSGHYWTVAQHLRDRVSPKPIPTSHPWGIRITDPVAGAIRLTGRFTLSPPLNPRAHGDGALKAAPAPPRPSTALLIVHGLGGSSESPYNYHAVHAAAHAGISSLRINLRGADRLGQDLFHAGLSADLEQALSTTPLADFERLVLLGYSLGGHLCLKYAAETPDPRVAAVAAICSPLDLRTSAAAFDTGETSLYRKHVLTGLKQMYHEVTRHNPGALRHLQLSWRQVQAINTIRDWDNHIIAPRHGFASGEHYYTSESVAARLRALRIPALLIHAAHDPMVPLRAVAPGLDQLPRHAESVVAPRGGHLGFPSAFNLGRNAPLGLEPQVLAWLLGRAERPISHR